MSGERFQRRTATEPQRRRCTVCVDRAHANALPLDDAAPLLDTWTIDTATNLSYCDAHAEQRIAAHVAAALTSTAIPPPRDKNWWMK